MKVHVEPRTLTQPLPGGGGEGTTVSVEPLKVGEVKFPGESFESTGGPLANLRALGVGTPRSRWWTVPCIAFLIRHPSAGAFIVDTGLHPSVTAKPSANFGRLAAATVKPKLDPGEDLPAQLRARGIDHRTLRLVVMTHLHYDHASGMSEFSGASFVLTDAEWRYATTVNRPILHGYRPAHYDYAFDYRTVSYNRANIESYSTFGRTFDLFGDGSVRLVSLPGHTPGHHGVLCRLRDRDLLIAGDAIYTHGQLTDRPPAPRPEDPHTYRRSLQELRLFHRQFPQAVIIPGHDPEFWATLDERYE
jgi:N-acyl homoserine lactone hydrolase